MINLEQQIPHKHLVALPGQIFRVRVQVALADLQACRGTIFSSKFATVKARFRTMGVHVQEALPALPLEARLLSEQARLSVGRLLSVAQVKTSSIISRVRSARRLDRNLPVRVKGATLLSPCLSALMKHFTVAQSALQ
ncbi:Uncharacterised protein [Chlamydia trachomatis]|nr:Uncharacterised protein [Chlamydia trachomatis]